MLLLSERSGKARKSVKQIIELGARRTEKSFVMGKLRDCEIMKTMTQLLVRN